MSRCSGDYKSGLVQVEKHSSEAETERWKLNIPCITIQRQNGKLHERVIGTTTQVAPSPILAGELLAEFDSLTGLATRSLGI
jgi:hypothetical protein